MEVVVPKCTNVFFGLIITKFLLLYLFVKNIVKKKITRLIKDALHDDSVSFKSDHMRINVVYSLLRAGGNIIN